METVTTAGALRRLVARWRATGDRVALVPTMGALHEGHLALVRRAGELAERTVVSIFVNPTQFGAGEDFDRYPRDPQADAELLAAEGVDLLFLPSVETIYPPGDATSVEVGGPAVGLEGEHRPGHFTGVATVVTKLFGLATPDLAVFGEKDAQQLAVVRRLVTDLHLPVEIVGHPTVRDEDGLALSSRNRYLSAGERRAARAIYASLSAAAGRIREGAPSAAQIRTAMERELARTPGLRLDYAEVVEGATFRPARELSGEVWLVAAARVGETRLIDGVRVEV